MCSSGDDLCPECEYYAGPDAHLSRSFYCNASCSWLLYYNKMDSCSYLEEELNEP